jgi:endonuclease/exonuclease/phosphatase family metal-dependent hydrolase
MVLVVALPTLSFLCACVSNVALVPDPAPSPCAAVEGPITWLRIPPGDERTRSDQWCAAVGPPAIVQSRSTSGIADRFVIVSWNVHVGGGNVRALVQDLRSGRLTGGQATESFALLLQEVYRSGEDVPRSLAPTARVARTVRPGGPARVDIVTTARALGLSLFYAPSMRNGPPTLTDEDRGSAILSTLPLDDLTAMELPLEHQRRIAVAASIQAGRGTPAPWLRLVSAHLTNAVGHHLWIASEPARLRQAQALARALDASGPTVVGGDFNTWFGYDDAAYREMRRTFRNPRPADRRPTFSIMRLDHVFYRLPNGWQATVRRAESRYGSDHYPLIAELTLAD